MSVATKCSVAAKEIAAITRSFSDDVVEKLSIGGMLVRNLFSRADNFMRSLGPAGEETATVLTDIVRRANVRSGTHRQEIGDALKGLSREERVAVGRHLDGLGNDLFTGPLPEKLVKVSNTIRRVLDRDLGAADVLGFKRSVNGKRLPIRGSGRAFPHILNGEGRRVLDAAHRSGLANGRVQAAAERMVKNGQASTVEEAVDKMRQIRDRRLRATNHYLESDRLEVPEEFVEYDPKLVLDGVVERNALTLEAARRWGQDFTGLQRLLGRIKAESGEPAARIVEDYLSAGFGVNGVVPKWHQAPAGALSNWETVSKLSGIFSPILNFGQRFVNTASAPIRVQARALRDLPPGAQHWGKAAQEITREIDRSGAISGLNPLTELSKQTTAGRKFARVALAPFFTVARGNEYHSAWVAKLAIEADVEALVRIQGRDSSVGRMLEVVRNLAIDPEGATKRRIGRRGVDPEQAADALRAGKRLTPDELRHVMQKAVEDEQFALNLVTNTIWWNTAPWMRLAFKFKTFGVRQTGHIWHSVVKEAMLGNAAPLAKFIGITAIMGEAYHVARDQIEGKDTSVASLLASRDPSKRTATEISYRILGNIGAQGGFGLLSDLHYGIDSWVTGPAGSTYANAKDLVSHVNQDASQTALAVKNALLSEVVPLRQVEGLIVQLDEKVKARNERFVQYHRLRSAARIYEDRETWENAIGEAKARVERALSGPPRFEVTPRTLRYHYAAKAVTAGEPGDAAEYLEGVFRTAKTPNEVNRLVAAAEASMRSRAPLGTLNEAQRREFLSLMPPDERRSVNALRRRWIRDYERAIRDARRNARMKAR